MMFTSPKSANRSIPVAVLMVAAAVVTANADGPQSEYYVVSGANQWLFKLQGSNILFDVASVGFDYPIAVDLTIRTTGGSEGTGGGEYDLDGNFLDTFHDRGADGFGNCVDGTTDGTFNYMASFTTGEIIRWGVDWTNPVVLFDTGRLEDTGAITYDPTDDSLWVGGFGTDIIEQYTLDGNLLSSFSTGVTGDGGIGSLALDHADGTLWFNVWPNSQHTFHQFSKDGKFLSDQTYEALAGLNILGGEFALPMPPGCPWDVNGDSVVDHHDLVEVVHNMGQCDDPDNCPWDVNGDGVVNGRDIAAVATHFGPCP